MQEWIVGLIVACALVAVLRRYLPKAARRALRAWMMQTALQFGWNGIAARLAVPEPAAASCGDGCGSCGGCGSGEASPITDEKFVIRLKTGK
jgi:hypothetical protein